MAPHRFDENRWNRLSPGDSVYLVRPHQGSVLELRVHTTDYTVTPGAAGPVGGPLVHTVTVVHDSPAGPPTVDLCIDPRTGRTVLGPLSPDNGLYDDPLAQAGYLLTDDEHEHWHRLSPAQRFADHLRRIAHRHTGRQASELGDFARELVELLDTPRH